MTKQKLLPRLNLILCILMILLIVAQIAVTFLPMINYVPEATRENPEPEAQGISLQQYIWLDCRNVEKHMTQIFGREYFINDYVHGPVLAFGVGLVALGFMIASRRNILSIALPAVWVGLTLDSYINGPLFTKIPELAEAGGTSILDISQYIQPASIWLAVGCAVLILLRAYPWWFVRYKMPRRRLKLK